jgi:hypothetical protein
MQEVLYLTYTGNFYFLLPGREIKCAGQGVRQAAFPVAQTERGEQVALFL